MMTHFTPSTLSFQSEYYLADELIAVGFLDVSTQGLNSVYFIYDPKYSKRSLGHFGVMKEIELANSLNLSYYYLGFYIKENDSMSYKNIFYPHEYLDWENNVWVDEYPLT